jgi:hypothetical protein
MGIDKRNYTKIDFYRELKTYIKIDPPKVLLSEIAQNSGEFMERFIQSFAAYDAAQLDTAEELCDRTLIFMNILKKSIKREIRKIRRSESRSEKERYTKRLIKNLDLSIATFRQRMEKINALNETHLRKTFHYANEYGSNLVYRYYQQLIYELETVFNKENHIIQDLKNSLKKEIDYRLQHQFPITSEVEVENNKLLRRWDVVKYFVIDKLILNTRVDKEVRYLLELLYSIAAGIAMIFATAIAFYYGKKFGNFTYGLFVVLVISYMFKDRIKEWGRAFFNDILKKQMLDHRFNLYDNNRKKIGVALSGFSFIPERNLPGEIRDVRYKYYGDRDIKMSEKIMKFTRKIRIKTPRLKATFQGVNIRGINDVIRFNFLPLTLRLEDPEVPIYLHNNDMDIRLRMADKSIPVHLVLVIKYGGQRIYQHYSLHINRKGIYRLKTMHTD